jgi:hypothetical protein
MGLAMAFHKRKANVIPKVERIVNLGRPEEVLG